MSRRTQNPIVTALCAILSVVLVVWKRGEERSVVPAVAARFAAWLRSEGASVSLVASGLRVASAVVDRFAVALDGEAEGQVHYAGGLNPWVGDRVASRGRPNVRGRVFQVGGVVGAEWPDGSVTFLKADHFALIERDRLSAAELAALLVGLGPALGVASMSAFAVAVPWLRERLPARELYGLARLASTLASNFAVATGEPSASTRVEYKDAPLGNGTNVSLRDRIEACVGGVSRRSEVALVGCLRDMRETHHDSMQRIERAGVRLATAARMACERDDEHGAVYEGIRIEVARDVHGDKVLDAVVRELGERVDFDAYLESRGWTRGARAASGARESLNTQRVERLARARRTDASWKGGAK